MQPINTKLAPEAIGTYSQAIRSGQTVFLSGQIPLDPETMKICSDDIKLQITQVLENLSAVCEAAGGSLANIVKLNVYLTDLSHFPLINEAMSRYFLEPYPARAAIEVSALPKGAKVEMDGILVLPASA
ncbi:RidA family protein [Legionella pneumophila]|uniref:Endoribonuclease L-PSP n=1 Tax=Legionella pneumophila subsp. pascullei TaxID=91890 RepID=A0AAX2IWM5_LEGPN|nr:RidA family protein [Legionella pneumophila]AMP89358.1 reactive intermediate/imine deaminase [Legionella pneumophila subsp. pascullei]AMP92975.1 reactive intermediate/imine deaminase [Legionella pneumophila subsp. pascullei]AMP95942.1 reactive intermediate/imine deaminase [Legionella pneumophila subsp. pascullei]SQG90865.1 endoribonuclease L-PSP [Legionella pneumophila subsp. pascullei]VEH07410.1 endoribonuclease L-PSP [Legionella pneumophila subsp. pascullei]